MRGTDSIFIIPFSIAIGSNPCFIFKSKSLDTNSKNHCILIILLFLDKLKRGPGGHIDY